MATDIVKSASKPLLAPVAPSVPADFRRAHPVASHVLPQPAGESLFSARRAKEAALVLPPPFPLTSPGPPPLKIWFPFNIKTTMSILLAGALPMGSGHAASVEDRVDWPSFMARHGPCLVTENVLYLQP